MARKGHVPERTCVGCRRKAPKGDLLRIAASRDGTLAPDPGARLPGRGAYLCYSEGCLRAAKKKLARALRCDPEQLSAVMSELEAAVRGRQS